MGGAHGLSALIIVLSCAAILVNADSERQALNDDRLVDGLMADFHDDDDMGKEQPKRVPFRSDLGKRDDEGDREVRDTRAHSRPRSFKRDLEKKRYSSTPSTPEPVQSQDPSRRT